jgi:hypothetical protein
VKRPRFTRRKFLALSAATAAAAAGTFAYAWRVEPHWIQVVRRDLLLNGLPASLVGRTVAQVSDLHVGPVVDADYLIAVLTYLRELHPDLIVLTGDYMTCRRDEQVDQTTRVLEHVPPAPLGRIAVLGNHDYGESWSRPDVSERLAGRFGDLGIALLRNANRDVHGLRVIGIDEFWTRNFRPADAVAGVDMTRDSLILCHNPDAADVPFMRGFRGWMLSGHTHGGQCKPPFLPPPLLPVRIRRYTCGAFDLGDGRSMYINRGLGYIRRMRFNARPEVTLFRLTAA